MPMFDNPEDAQSYMERVQMAHSGQRHKMFDALDQLDKDQLIAMHEIFEIIAIGDNSKIAAYFDGLTSMILEKKFDICAACEQNHDEVLKEGSTEEPSKPLLPEEEVHLRTMEEYNVRRGDPSTLEVICKGCGTVYQSLDDRMLERPGLDGCHECKRRSAWG